MKGKCERRRERGEERRGKEGGGKTTIREGDFLPSKAGREDVGEETD